MTTRDHIQEVGLGSGLVATVVVLSSGSIAAGAIALVFVPLILWAVIRLHGRLP